MPTPRSGHGWATYNNRIYLVGGEGRDYHVEGVFRDIEAFDPATNEWDKLPPMPTARMRGQARAASVRGMVSVTTSSSSAEPEMRSMALPDSTACVQ